MSLIPWGRRDVAGPIGGLQGEMNRMFDDFFGRDFAVEPFGRGGEWIPALEVSELDTAVAVKAELPGLDPKDIEVTLANDVLTIKGEKKHESETKEKNFHLVERSYGSFERSVRLPTGVKPDAVDAKFKNGVLTVELPKAEEARTKAVKIKVE